jgi:hypothetical protein
MVPHVAAYARDTATEEVPAWRTLPHASRET